MPIIARDFDVSEKKFTFTEQLPANTHMNGSTTALFVVPFPFEVVAVGSAVVGSTGTINLQLQNYRVIMGPSNILGTAGATMYGAMNASFALSALGTSGPQWALGPSWATTAVNVGWSLPITGSTILQGQAGDVLTLVAFGTGAVNAASTITVVVKKLQDIAQHFNTSS